MANGAVTLGTMDGANVEIHDLVGDENIAIFGESSEKVMELYEKASYTPPGLLPVRPGDHKASGPLSSAPQVMRLGDPENPGPVSTGT